MSPNSDYDKKLDNAVSTLNNLLRHYINIIRKINETYIYENGIHPSTVFINTEPVPINTYTKTEYTYDIF